MIGGALRSPPDDSDWIFERIARGAASDHWEVYPEEYDLRRYSQCPRDQGGRGTCAAFTAAAIKEIQEKLDCDFNAWMSPEFIYYHRNNKPMEGMYGRDVFQILQKVGSVPESIFPYGENCIPSKSLYNIAQAYRIANFARVTSVEGLKRALVDLGPCYLLLPLYGTRPEFWRPDGRGECESGHAVTVVGYNRDGFILRNSWGSDWNGDGHILFPYNEWGLQWECWVSVDEKTEQKILADIETPRVVTPRVVTPRIVIPDNTHEYESDMMAESPRSFYISQKTKRKSEQGRKYNDRKHKCICNVM